MLEKGVDEKGAGPEVTRSRGAKGCGGVGDSGFKESGVVGVGRMGVVGRRCGSC